MLKSSWVTLHSRACLILETLNENLIRKGSYTTQTLRSNSTYVNNNLKTYFLFAKVTGSFENKKLVVLDNCLNKKFFSMSDSEDKKGELKKRLTTLQYHVTQEKGTERPYSGKYNKCYDQGTYSCVVCEQPLFSSETKYDSGCGWPAFNDVLDQGKVKLSKDTSLVGGNILALIANPGMVRTEVTCMQCGAHLGHMFGDGPPPARRRFCINSASLEFHPAGSPIGNGNSQQST